MPYLAALFIAAIVIFLVYRKLEDRKIEREREKSSGNGKRSRRGYDPIVEGDKEAEYFI